MPIHQKSGRNLQNKSIQMSQRIFLTVVVCIFLSKGEIFAQKKNVEKFPVITANLMSLTEKSVTATAFFPIKKFSVNDPQIRVNDGFFGFSNSVFARNPLRFIEDGYYIKHVGFFCRKEWQIEKTISIPLRLRLGSLEYTNYLEQKPNSLKP